MMMDTSGGGSSGMSPAMAKLMQRKMMEQMFGLDASVRPIHVAAVTAGDDPNGSFGVIGVRLYAATMTSPTPKLYLETNGKLLVTPDVIPVLAKFFQSVEGEFSEKYSLALEAAKNLEGAEIFAAGLGLDTGETASG